MGFIEVWPVSWLADQHGPSPSRAVAQWLDEGPLPHTVAGAAEASGAATGSALPHSRL